MTSRIGTNEVFLRPPADLLRESKRWGFIRLGQWRADKGFTLIEAMIATIILALGTTFLSRSFFIALDSYNYCSRYLRVMSWADEKVWTAEDALSRFGSDASLNTSGAFTEKGKDFNWSLAYSPLDAEGSLFKIDFTMSWQEGARKARIQRSTYARHEKDQ